MASLSKTSHIVKLMNLYLDEHLQKYIWNLVFGTTVNQLKEVIFPLYNHIECMSDQSFTFLDKYRRMLHFEGFIPNLKETLFFAMTGKTHYHNHSDIINRNINRHNMFIDDDDNLIIDDDNMNYDEDETTHIGLTVEYQAREIYTASILLVDYNEVKRMIGDLYVKKYHALPKTRFELVRGRFTQSNVYSSHVWTTWAGDILYAWLTEQHK